METIKPGMTGLFFMVRMTGMSRAHGRAGATMSIDVGVRAKQEPEPRGPTLVGMRPPVGGMYRIL